MNYLRFQGWVVSISPLRYSPAGVAVCELVLQHDSTVEQASVPRQLSFETDAIAMGDTAVLVSSLEIGQLLEIQGFIAPLRKSSSRLILHIQSFQTPNATPNVLV
ncbi:primosomal replication protein N [Paenalcaligenes hominis]|uniref:primosomal replication protein N n=1 Tax=Paenalcaligenes hominis TaxID=643674 RepID=UPI003525D0B3